MTVSVKHIFNCAIPDDPAAVAAGEVTPGHWNENHTITGLAPVASSGAYSDLSGTPSLAAVATTGHYSDLTGTPTLGTAASHAATDFQPAGNYSTGGGTATGTNTGDQTNITGSAGTVSTISGMLAAGTNVTLTGSGTSASPYTIAASSGGGGTPGGSSGQLQYNNGGAFGGTAYTTDGTNITFGSQTVLGNNSLVTSSGLLRLGQTGAQYGPTYLDIVNGLGANGAIFTSTNTSVTLIDFGFKTGAGFQSNLRFEGRSGAVVGAGNGTFGEFQFLMNATTAGNANYSVPLTFGAQTVALFVPGAGGGATYKGRLGLRIATPLAVIHAMTDSTTPCGIDQGASGQSADLRQWQDNSGAVLSRVKADGSIGLVTLTDAAATNGSLYFSSTTSKLTYKDSSGTLHAV